MKVLKTSAYVGPNIVAPVPGVHLRWTQEQPLHWPGQADDSACTERLLELLPGLYEHPGRGNEPGALAEHLRATPPLPLGYVIARIATELQRLEGDTVQAAMFRQSKDGRFANVFFRYRDPEIGLLSGRTAITLALALLPQKIRTELGLSWAASAEAVIEDFRRQRKRLGLDQTARALIAKAEQRDIPWFVVHRGMRVVQMGQGCHARRICETITTATPHIGAMLQNDKAATNSLLAEVYLPVPRQAIVDTADAALEAARHLGFPVVVKPHNAKKGLGVTLQPETDEAIRAAFAHAHEHSRYVLVEKHIAGDDHRVLVVGGRMVAAAKRIPAMVTGNGSSTIAELVAETNKDPRRGTGFSRVLNLIELDEQADQVLARQGHSRDSVPPDKEVVYLRGTANIATGGSAVDVTEKVHPSNRRMLERTARTLELDVAGIDFITPDISRPHREVQGAICEVNASPGLRAHLVDENAPDVVGPIIDLLFPKVRNGRIPIAAITGTNGKTTTSRMLAHILRVGGSDIGVNVVGLVTTSGVYINGDPVLKGDLAGLAGAKVLLRDPSVEAAVLETARGGLARTGFAADCCDVGAVMNIASDHLGQDGINSLDEMAALKGRVAEAARKLALLNADDARCRALAGLKDPQQLGLVSMAPLGEGLRDHLARGGLAITLEPSPKGPMIVIHHAGTQTPLLTGLEIPASLGGAAVYNIQNAMFAAGLAHGLGLSAASITKALKGFRNDPEHNPGRLNVFDGHPFKVVLDYAHNPHGVDAVCSAVRGLEVTGRRICVLANAGNRHAEHIAEVSAVVADKFDFFICSRDGSYSEAHTAARGFPPEEIPLRLAASLKNRGIGAQRLEIIDDEQTAVTRALDMAEEGDLLVIFSTESEWCWNRIVHHAAEDSSSAE
ncbi:Mur ligase family protein [Pelagibius sp.]|uniref:glutamate ligase domain-containing protein n=1 Tax=Pelagibius sp. TaxID=1931238 RepID=UPI002617EDD8|nr:Mur ligase family protein [Pelagibius sp.]